jgi:hypothetical protein
MLLRANLPGNPGSYSSRLILKGLSHYSSQQMVHASQVVELSKPAHFKGTVSPDYRNLKKMAHAPLRPASQEVQLSKPALFYPFLFINTMICYQRAMLPFQWGVTALCR